MNRNPSISVYEWETTPLIIQQCEEAGKDIPSDQYLYWIEEIYRATSRSGSGAAIAAVHGLIDQIEIEISEFVAWDDDVSAIAFDILQAGHARWISHAEYVAASIAEDLRREGF